MRTRLLMVTLIAVACCSALGAQAPNDDEAVWGAFLAWFKTASPSENPIMSYAAALEKMRTPDPEIRRRVKALTKLLPTRSDWVEPYFDKTFARPVTGNPARDGFTAVPSAFLAEVASTLRPGAALDVGMGQGRNAIFLAAHGWNATGFDLSGEAVSAARANAERAAVRLDALKAGYADFDFGKDKWDLIVLAFAWAPVSDHTFLARLRAGLRPGGRVVFEHFIDDPARPRPAAVHALREGELRALFSDFTIERYEETVGTGDWGGPGERLVRMVALKPERDFRP